MVPRPKVSVKPDNEVRKGAASSAPTDARPGLGRIIRAFKSLSAIEVNRALGRRSAPVWQRNYFEHVVRAGEDLDEIRRYISENPAQWDVDREHPARKNVGFRDESGPALPWQL